MADRGFPGPARRLQPDDRGDSLPASRSSLSAAGFIWQEYDVHPRFPRLKSFLDFWSTNLEGKLYRVTVVPTVSSRRLSCG